MAVPAGVSLNVEPQQEEVDEDGAKFVDIPKADLDKMNVGSLKSELARRGVKAKGKKAELKARLIDALARSVKALPEGMVKARGNVLGGFAETAYWSQLKPRVRQLANQSMHSLAQGHQQSLRMKQSKLLPSLTLASCLSVRILLALTNAMPQTGMAEERWMLLGSRSKNRLL